MSHPISPHGPRAATLVAIVWLASASIASAQAPTNVQARASSPTSVEISWDAVAGARGYSVERAASAAGPWTRLTENTFAANHYTDTSAPAASTLVYRVRSRSPGPGNKTSDPVSVITPPAGAALPAPAQAEAPAAPAFQPRTVNTGTLQWTGLRFRPVSVNAGTLQWTGLRFQPVTVNTGTLQWTGLRE